MDEYEDYYFDDAVGGSEGGYSGNMSNYDSSFTPQQSYDTGYNENSFQQPASSYMGDNWNSMYGGSGPEQYNYNPQQPSTMNEMNGFDAQELNPQWASQGMGAAPTPSPSSGIQSFLQDMFNKKQTGSDGAAGMMGGMGSNIVKGLGGLLGSFAQQKSNSTNTSLGNKVMQQMDPFGAQRAGYQKKLADTYTNPMGTLQRPEIAGQLAQMKQVMDANDAKAGRRSQYGSRMNQLAEQQAKLMDSYREQLGKFAGSQFGPNVGAGASILQGANNVNSNPMNPLIAAAGNIMQGNDIGNEKQDVLSQIQALLKKG
jgi:hypothetical protein